MFGLFREFRYLLRGLFRVAQNACSGDAPAFAGHHFDQVSGGFALRISLEQAYYRRKIAGS